MKIAIVNQSQRLAAKDVDIMVKACQDQATLHFAPAWELLPPVLKVVASMDQVPDGYIAMVLMDAPDAPGALGYHSEASDKIYGRIFVNPVLDNGGVVLFDTSNPGNVSVSSVLSHEVCELICDPFIDYWVDGPVLPQGPCYALEVCDPVQGDSYTMPVQNVDGTPLAMVSLSNFVLPSWFDDQAPDGSKVDYMGTAKGPFQMTPGGYMVVRNGPGSEQQVFGETMPPAWRQKKADAARTVRRGAKNKE